MSQAAPAPRRPRVAVLFGGRSSEHGVSALTAREVMAAIDPDEYDVLPIGITRDGRWVLQPGPPQVTGSGRLPELDESGDDVMIGADPRRTEVVATGDGVTAPGPIDVVLPLLHGPWGEDGTLQGMLELAGVPYVGAGVLASAVGMDKHYMKIVFADAGLDQLPYVVVTPRRWRDEPDGVRADVAALGYPVFVKPSRAGSSMGVSRVDGPAQLDAAIETARAEDPKVIVEALADGAREIECGVLQAPDGTPQTSVVGEITVAPDSDHDFYDFEAKYLDGTGELSIPADLPDEVAASVRAQSARAFEALGCEGLSRVDFFRLPDGRLVINELNTMPGFTPSSMYPRLWAATGVDYPTLVDRLLRLALARSTGLR